MDIPTRSRVIREMQSRYRFVLEQLVSKLTSLIFAPSKLVKVPSLRKFVTQRIFQATASDFDTKRGLYRIRVWVIQRIAISLFSIATLTPVYAGSSPDLYSHGETNAKMSTIERCHEGHIDGASLNEQIETQKKPT